MTPLDKETLFTLAKALVMRKLYFISPHAQENMKKRSITEEEIIHIITEPYEVIGEPRYDIKYKTYKYKLVGFYSDRSVVIAINFEKLLVVVTVID